MRQAYKGFGSFHGESVDSMIKAAAAGKWSPPAVPPAVAAAARALPGAPPASFGAPMKRAQFLLDPAWTFVNHGAFGAPCRHAMVAAQVYEKDAKLAQKLGQLQPFVAAFPLDDRNVWTFLNILGQPNNVLAARPGASTPSASRSRTSTASCSRTWSS
jgi:hypothetical protein